MTDLAYRFVIDGQWCENDSDGIVEVINPAAEQVIGRVRQASTADAQRAIAAARRAFDDGPWPRTPAPDRARVLSAMADIMERRFDELTELNMAGAARTIAENVQIRPAIYHLRDMAERVLIQYPFEQPALPTHLGGAFSQGIMRRSLSASPRSSRRTTSRSSSTS